MSHLDENRFLLLGLEPGAEPTADEAAHLACCAACASRLDSERALTFDLEALSLPEPSSDFVPLTTARFARALAAREDRRTAWIVVAALVVAPLLLAPMAGILVANAGQVLAAIAAVIGYGATLGRALFVVVGKLPQVTVTLAVMLGFAALASSVLIGRLAVATADAK